MRPGIHVMSSRLPTLEFNPTGVAVIKKLLAFDSYWSPAVQAWMGRRAGGGGGCVRACCTSHENNL